MNTLHNCAMGFAFEKQGLRGVKANLKFYGAFLADPKSYNGFKKVVLFNPEKK